MRSEADLERLAVYSISTRQKVIRNSIISRELGKIRESVAQVRETSIDWELDSDFQTILSQVESAVDGLIWKSLRDPVLQYSLGAEQTSSEQKTPVHAG